jgi:TonB family protein
MESISRLLPGLLINSVWQVTVVFLLALLLARLVRSAPARYLHGFWVLTLGVCVLLPIMSVRSSRQQPGTPVPTVVLAPLAGPAAGAVPAVPQPLAQAQTPSAQPPAARPSLLDELRRTVERPIPCPPALARALTLGYGLFLLYALARFGYAWRRKTRILRNASAPPASPELQRIATDTKHAFGLDDVRILWSPDAPSPLTAGIRRPVIVLPECLLNEPSEQVLTAVLAHEMAHIQRRDFFFNLVYELLLLPFSFHPAALAVRARIARTREQACDEIVAARSVEAPVYARALLDLARLFSPARAPRYSLGACDAEVLEERVMRIINLRNLTGSRRTRLLLVSACLAVLALGVAASAVPLQVEQPTTESRVADSIKGPPRGVVPNTVVQVSERPDRKQAAIESGPEQPGPSSPPKHVPSPETVPSAPPSQTEQKSAQIGLIAGVVKDANGAPVANATIWLLDQHRDARARFKAAQAQPGQTATVTEEQQKQTAREAMEALKRAAAAPRQPDQAVTTNERGEFLIQALAGVYYVEVMGEVSDQRVQARATQRVSLHQGQVQRADFVIGAPKQDAQQTGQALPREVAVGGLVQEGKCLECAAPTYPAALRGSGVKGSVLLYIHIGTDGSVDDVIVLESTAPEFAAAALDAVRHWRYKQTFLNGEPVTVSTSRTLDFEPL